MEAIILRLTLLRSRGAALLSCTHPASTNWTASRTLFRVGPEEDVNYCTIYVLLNQKVFSPRSIVNKDAHVSSKSSNAIASF